MSGYSLEIVQEITQFDPSNMNAVQIEPSTAVLTTDAGVSYHLTSEQADRVLNGGPPAALTLIRELEES